MEFTIRTSWDGKPLEEADHVTIFIGPQDKGLELRIDAPFYNDPPAPSGPGGQAFPQLWDYEVVEAFFMGTGQQYLEVEVCPHGQHLVLALRGARGILTDKLELTFEATILKDGRWTGSATIPREYLPAGLSKFNAYAIHGSGEARLYSSLYPAVGDFDVPDFHRLQFFQETDFSTLLPVDHSGSLWARI